MQDYITQKEGHWILKIWVQPNASKSQIVGEHDGHLKIKLKAPPVDGKANKELVHYLAKLLELRKSDIALVKGDTARAKTLKIQYSGDLRAKIALVLYC